MMNRIFVDTSFIIALYNLDDEYHQNAIAILSKIKNCQFILTKAILLEIGNTFSKVRFRKIGIEIIKRLENDSRNLIIPYNTKLHTQAIQMFESRLDKNWSLTDCASFTVMKEYGVTRALTSDKHFQQAGFNALLLNI